MEAQGPIALIGDSQAMRENNITMGNGPQANSRVDGHTKEQVQNATRYGVDHVGASVLVAEDDNVRPRQSLQSRHATFETDTQTKPGDIVDATSYSLNSAPRLAPNSERTAESTATGEADKTEVDPETRARERRELWAWAEEHWKSPDLEARRKMFPWSEIPGKTSTPQQAMDFLEEILAENVSDSDDGAPATTTEFVKLNENKNESSPSNYNPERNDGSDPDEVIDAEKSETTWQRARREWLALTAEERENYFPWMRTEYTAGTATPQQAMDALEEILAENAWSDDDDDDDKKPE